MKNPNEELIRRFYDAFQAGDYRTMQDCYHHQATFKDPVFMNLNAAETKAMWKMLITSARDLRIAHSDVKANDTEGTARWDAWYTFSKTGRKVHNVIDASMQFRDGKIWHHEDRFDLWRWSRQAIGGAGMLFGWSALVTNPIRETARRSLNKFMAQELSQA
jgi:ketosteroid isomerase-like protein